MDKPLLTREQEQELARSLGLSLNGLSMLAVAVSHGGKVACRPPCGRLHHLGLVDSHHIVTPAGRHLVNEARAKGW